LKSTETKGKGIIPQDKISKQRMRNSELIAYQLLFSLIEVFLLHIIIIIIIIIIIKDDDEENEKINKIIHFLLWTRTKMNPFLPLRSKYLINTARQIQNAVEISERKNREGNKNTHT
jgi:hypothetical protein